MKNHLSLYACLLFPMLIISCHVSNHADVPKDSASKSETRVAQQPETTVPDVDPYFIETQTITAPYGPRSITRNIMQDKNGNIWLASWEGIIRYDGKSFTNFTNKEKLRRFHAFSVLEDSAGNLWFGTIGAGVYRYDGNTFTNFTKKEGLAQDWVTCMLEDAGGNIWLGTAGGVSCYDGKTFINFTTKEGLCDDDVNTIAQDPTGKIWIGTRQGTCFYDGKSFTGFTQKDGSPFVNIRCITTDKNGNLWLGGQQGLWRYAGNALTKYSTDFVGYVFEDKKGDIWTCGSERNTRGMSLYRYDGHLLPSAQAAATKIAEQQGGVFGILEDRDGNIWFGTEQGVCRYDGKSFNYFRE